MAVRGELKYWIIPSLALPQRSRSSNQFREFPDDLLIDPLHCRTLWNHNTYHRFPTSQRECKNVKKKFLMWSPLLRRLIFNHRLWSVFQSSLCINILHFQRTFCNQLSMYYIYHGVELVSCLINTHIAVLLKTFVWKETFYCFVELVAYRKNPLPCQDLNPRPPWYQSNPLPTELSWLDEKN